MKRSFCTEEKPKLHVLLFSSFLGLNDDRRFMAFTAGRLQSEGLSSGHVNPGVCVCVCVCVCVSLWREKPHVKKAV